MPLSTSINCKYNDKRYGSCLQGFCKMSNVLLHIKLGNGMGMIGSNGVHNMRSKVHLHGIIVQDGNNTTAYIHIYIYIYTYVCAFLRSRHSIKYKSTIMAGNIAE